MAVAALMAQDAAADKKPYFWRLVDGGSDSQQAGSLGSVVITGSVPALPTVVITGSSRPASLPTVLAEFPSSSGASRDGTSSGPAPANPGHSQTDEPVSDDNTATTGCASEQNSNPASGHPVIIATGEKHTVEQDILAGGSYGLGLQRTYRSFRATTGLELFGPKWLSSQCH